MTRRVARSAILGLALVLLARCETTRPAPSGRVVAISFDGLGGVRAEGDPVREARERVGAREPALSNLGDPQLARRPRDQDGGPDNSAHRHQVNAWSERV